MGQSRAISLYCLFLLGIELASPMGILAQGTGNKPAPYDIKITSRASLIHIGSLDSFDRTPEGTAAAKLVIKSVSEKDQQVAAEAAREAIKIYDAIIPNQNFGGEYTSLKWICEYQAGSKEVRAAMLAQKYPDSPYTGEMFLREWSRDDFKALKEYIRFKYKIEESRVPEDRDSQSAHRWREDFILFNNPRREDWERTSEFMAKLKLKPGQRVIDLGCGPGFFTFKFAQMVGPTGMVYAVDNNPGHIEYITNLAPELGLKNIQVYGKSRPGEILLPENAKDIDLVYLCSLWHVLYTFGYQDQANLIEKIKKCLKPGGKLVIVDNAMIHPKEGEKEVKMPYHGPYIDKDLVIGQMQNFGMKLAEPVHQIIPQRYMLVFEVAGEANPPSKKAPAYDLTAGVIRIDSPTALVGHLKGPPTERFSLEGRKAASELYAAMKDNKRELAQSALARFKKLSKSEETGDETTAFVWFCEYFLANEADKKSMLHAELLNADYVESLGGNELADLKRYLWNRFMLYLSDKEYASILEDKKSADEGGYFFHMAERLRRTKKDINTGQDGFFSQLIEIVRTKDKRPDMSLEAIIELHERMVFNNPYRKTWEHSDEILKIVNLKPGEAVADVGCGHGYYTFKFAKAVTNAGKVFALETNDETFTIFKRNLSNHKEFTNIVTVRSTYDSCHLPPNSVDVMFMCSVYDAIYTTSIDFVRDRFIKSVKDSLRDTGRLVIVDNEIFVGASPAYYGPRIDRRLIIEQLKHYGFKLVNQAQPIPQRYVLVFQKDFSKKGKEKK